MSRTSLKLIAVTIENYRILKDLGGAGDSFNDVISRLLRSQKFDNENRCRRFQS
jgi:predicted CopG family antitoxin